MSSRIRATDADRYAQAGFDFTATGLDVLLLKSAAEAKVARHRSTGTPSRRY